ncbi:MAG TPA: tyrosine-type recombinase/integrase [Pseudonocardiaceae bacterium]|jgi:site-specific recombinase XerC|nr:tyrosine-type recombinase/integrase [Pseudonocardiaceae bacterium]
MQSTHRWHPLLREWERTLSAENKAPKTIQVYGDGTRQLIVWLDRLPVESSEDLARPATLADITKQHLVGWMNHLLSISKPATANNRYRAVQQWFNWMLIEGEIDTHPMSTMKPPFIPEQQVPLVPMDLIRAILAGCDGRDLISRRDTALIRLIWDTGARLNEIATLTVDDVALDLDVIHVLGKGRRPRSVPFGPKRCGGFVRRERPRNTVS